MCGRVVCGLDSESLIRIANSNGMKNKLRYSPSYNISPSRYIGAIYKKSNSNCEEGENLKHVDGECSFKESGNSDGILPDLRGGKTLTNREIDVNSIDETDNDLKLKISENKCKEYAHDNCNISDEKENKFSTGNKSSPRDNPDNIIISEDNEKIQDKVFIFTPEFITEKVDLLSERERSLNSSIQSREHSYDLEAMKWGTRTKDNHFVINARSETLHATSFKNFKRCVVIIQGYFEWKQENKASQPYYIHNKSNEYMLLAALYKDTYDKVNIF